MLNGNLRKSLQNVFVFFNTRGTRICIERKLGKDSSKSKIGIFAKKNSSVNLVSEFSSTNIAFRKLLKPFAFTVCFSSGCFVCATIWQHESIAKRKHAMYNWFDRPHTSYKRGQLRRQLYSMWNSQTEGQKVASVIIAVNTFVFLLWKFPFMMPFMQKYFCASPANKAICLPMITSVFSHYNFLHLAANMYVLYSFSTIGVDIFGKEQFMAFYCSAGVISSFASYLHKVIACRYSPSLGASGALMAVLSSTCIQVPNTQLAFILIPFLTVSAGKAIKFVMALDVVGILAKWQFLDHAAHLGGALFGIAYLCYGKEYIWGSRGGVICLWHHLKKKTSKLE